MLLNISIFYQDVTKPLARPSTSKDQSEPQVEALFNESIIHMSTFAILLFSSSDSSDSSSYSSSASSSSNTSTDSSSESSDSGSSSDTSSSDDGRGKYLHRAFQNMFHATIFLVKIISSLQTFYC